MASKFRKVGVTAVGACAGAAVAAWALNSKDKSPYMVCIGIMELECRSPLLQPFNYMRLTIRFAGECCGYRYATCETTTAATYRTSENVAERRGIRCADYWWRCHWSRLCIGLNY